MKQIKDNLIQKSWHVILGLDLLMIGFNLVLDNGYFLFPPFMIPIMNDDLVGMIGIGIGVGLLVWSGQGGWNVHVNRWLLVGACTFLTCITCFELMHAVHFQMPHSISASINDVIILMFALNLTYHSKTKE